MPGGFWHKITFGRRMLNKAINKLNICHSDLNMYLSKLGRFNSGNGDNLCVRTRGSCLISSNGGVSKYPIRSTLNLWLSRLRTWYCIRGLRPMSPNTITHTLRLLFADIAFGRLFSFLYFWLVTTTATAMASTATTIAASLSFNYDDFIASWCCVSMTQCVIAQLQSLPRAFQMFAHTRTHCTVFM